MNKFQIIVIAVFLGLILISFLIFAGVIPGLPGRSKEPAAKLQIWGDLPKEKMGEIINKINFKNQKKFILRYKEIAKDNYESQLINSLAGGRGPDIWLLSQDFILKHRDKVLPISFKVFNERNFKDFFVEESELYLFKDGFWAVPFWIDPMVMYWNRDLFNSAGIAQPPKDWEEFLKDVKLLTKKDEIGNIIQSGAALGEFSNINHAKDIFSLLILQGGNPIVEPKSLKLVFGSMKNGLLNPTISALRFYTDFSNPTKLSYSWNNALPFSRDMFIAGKLAMYFGYVSEFNDIRSKNPHLNFDVALMPQVEDSSKITFGRLKALAISKFSKHPNLAMNAAFQFLDKEIQNEIKDRFSLPPIRRDMLKEENSNSNAAFSIFYKSALWSRGWLEPDPQEVSKIFENMIESVARGKKSESEAVSEARSMLGNLLDNYVQKN